MTLDLGAIQHLPDTRVDMYTEPDLWWGPCESSMYCAGLERPLIEECLACKWFDREIWERWYKHEEWCAWWQVYPCNCQDWDGDK